MDVIIQTRICICICMYIDIYLYIYVYMYTGLVCLIPCRWMFHSEEIVRTLSSHRSHGQFFICSSTSCHQPSTGQYIPMVAGGRGSPLHLWFLQNHTWKFFLCTIKDSASPTSKQGSFRLPSWMQHTPIGFALLGSLSNAFFTKNCGDLSTPTLSWSWPGNLHWKQPFVRQRPQIVGLAAFSFASSSLWQISNIAVDSASILSCARSRYPLIKKSLKQEPTVAQLSVTNLTILCKRWWRESHSGPRPLLCSTWPLIILVTHLTILMLRSFRSCSHSANRSDA